MPPDPKSNPSLDAKLEKLSIDASLSESALERFEKRLISALESRHAFFVAQVAKRLRGTSLISAGKPAAGAAVESGEWIDIESLSRLRGMVGGRFQNLRERWVNAGFPLREHRGDKGGSFKVDPKGWQELSNWVLAQGYEARLVSDRPGCLFQLRSVKAKNQ